MCHKGEPLPHYLHVSPLPALLYKSHYSRPSLTPESSTCPLWVLSELSTSGLVATLLPLLSLPSKHPKAATLGCGLDLVLPLIT